MSPAEITPSWEVHRQSGGCTFRTGTRRPSVPAIHPVPSLPVRPEPPRGAAGAAALLTRPAPAAGRLRRRAWVPCRRRRPNLYPPEGQRRPGPPRDGAATFSLFGRLCAIERPRSHEWSPASPAAARLPGPCKAGAGQRAPGPPHGQIGSPAQPLGGQRSQGAAWQGGLPGRFPGARLGSGRRRPEVSTPAECWPRWTQKLETLGVGGRCGGGCTAVFYPSFSFFH